jgi:hypothetical protein
LISHCIVIICLRIFLLLNCEISKEVTVSHICAPNISHSVNICKNVLEVLPPSHSFIYPPSFVFVRMSHFFLKLKKINISFPENYYLFLHFRYRIMVLSTYTSSSKKQFSNILLFQAPQSSENF